MLFRSVTRLCPASAAPSHHHLSTAISKDVNPYAQACLKVPTSILRIKNRLQVPTGERQQVGLKPLPPARTPEAPAEGQSLSLSEAMAQLDGDPQRATSVPLARLWSSTSGFSVSANADDSMLVARQQALDVDSVTPPEESSLNSAQTLAQSASSSPNTTNVLSPHFNSISRDCVCRATFLGTIVFAEKSSDDAMELVMLCEENDQDQQQKKGILICVRVDAKQVSRPTVTAAGGLTVASRCLVSGSLRVQRTAAAVNPSASESMRQSHHTLPVLDKLTSISCFKNPAAAAGMDGEKFARELLEETEIC